MSTTFLQQKHRDVLEAVATQLNAEEFRPLNQRYWALKIGVVQQTVSEGLRRLVERGVLEPGPPDGTTHMYRLNATHPDVRALTANHQPDGEMNHA